MAAMVARNDIPPPSREDAVSLTALALYLASAVQKRNQKGASPRDGRRHRATGVTLKSVYDSLADSPRFKVWAGRSEQWYRRLVRAYEVFGDEFKDQVARLGITRVILLAKHKKSKSLAKGRLRLASRSGRRVGGPVAASRDIEAVLRMEGSRSGSLSQKPGPVFRVPRDLILIEGILVDRMKSLIPRRAGVEPRCAFREMSTAEVRKLKQLRDVLRILDQTLEYAIASDLVDPESVGPRDDQEKTPASLVVPSELRELLYKASRRRRGM